MASLPDDEKNTGGNCSTFLCLCPCIACGLFFVQQCLRPCIPKSKEEKAKEERKEKRRRQTMAEHTLATEQTRRMLDPDYHAMVENQEWNNKKNNQPNQMDMVRVTPVETPEAAFTNLKVDIVAGPHKGESTAHALNHQENVRISVGADEACHIVMGADEKICDEHGSICWMGKQTKLVYVDQDSIHGSKINGKAVEAGLSGAKRALVSGDKIEVGESILLVMMS